MGYFCKSQLSIVRLGLGDAGAVLSLAAKVESEFEKRLNGIHEFLEDAENKALNLSIGLYRNKKLVGYVLACMQVEKGFIPPSFNPKNTDGIPDLQTGIFVADIALENNNRLLAIRIFRNFIKLARLMFNSDCFPVYVYCSEIQIRALLDSHRFLKRYFINIKGEKSFFNKYDIAISFLCFEVSFPELSSSKSLYQKLQCKLPVEKNNRIIVGVLKTYRAFESLCPYWNPLLEKTKSAINLQEYQFLKSWYVNIGWPCRLYFIVILFDGKPIAIAPFQINKVKVFNKVIKRMAFLGLNKEMDRQTIFFEDDKYNLTKVIVDFLAFNKNDWDQIALLEQKIECHFVEKFSNYMKKAGFLIGFSPRPVCPFIKINGTWDEYLRSKNRSLRKSIRRKIETLKNKGEIRLDVVWPLEGDDFLDRYLHVEARSWKCADRKGVRKTSGHFAFYRSLANTYGQKGLFKFGFLTLNNIPIAATFGIGWRHSFYSLQICHDERFSKESPGFVLTAMELENMFEDGRFSIFDFLGGALHNKLSWSTNSDSTQNIFVNRFTFFGIFYHFMVFKVKPLLIRLNVIKRVG